MAVAHHLPLVISQGAVQGHDEVDVADPVVVAAQSQRAVQVEPVDRQELGHVAAQIRSLRPPDPYKNKGVRYTGEALRKKAGKTGAGAK